MKLLNSKKWANIEIDGRKCGQIIMAILESNNKKGKYLIYVSYRNSSHVMKKKFPGSFGMSIAVLDKLQNIHHVPNIIIKYERQDGKFEYYMSKVNDWLKSEKEYYNGLDKQKFLSIMELQNFQLEVVNEGNII